MNRIGASSSINRKRKASIIYQCIYVESRLMALRNLVENGLVDTAVDGEDGTDRESSIDIYTLSCVN